MAAEIGERLTKVETLAEGFTRRFDDLRWVLALLATVMFGGFALLDVSIDRRFSSVDRDIDELRGEVRSIREELRGIRSDSADLPDRVSQQIQRAVDLTLQAFRAGQAERPGQVPVPGAPATPLGPNPARP